MVIPDSNKFMGYWNLDEASGDAIDATGRGHTLTETSGTIPPVENGRDFEAGDTEYFEGGNHADFAPGDANWTVGIWFKPETTPAGEMGIIGKYINTNYNRLYLVYTSGTTVNFIVSGNGSTTQRTWVTSTTAIAAGSKYFVLGWHDATANKIYIQVNNGAVAEAAHTYGIHTNTATPFQIGKYATNYADGIGWSGFLYSGVMSAVERASMYNNGTPMKWNNILCPQKYTTKRGINLLGRHGRRLVY
jgi:hypothetical protein